MIPAQPIRNLLLIWLGWSVVLFSSQHWAGMRVEPQRPDRVLDWTPPETSAGSQGDKPYLIEPFLNEHVSWDSEFYLSVSTEGYDDPRVRAIPPDYNPIPFLRRFCISGRDRNLSTMPRCLDAIWLL